MKYIISGSFTHLHLGFGLSELKFKEIHCVKAMKLRFFLLVLLLFILKH